MACPTCFYPFGDGVCPTCRGTYAPFPGSDAHMFIQWKGTDVCMDFHCPCGESSHLDTYFAYYVRCPACKAVYELGTQVRARRLGPTEDQQEDYAKEGEA